MTAQSISLERVIELGVPRSWQEAVAVAVEAGEAMKLHGMAISIEDCLLTAGGTLKVSL